MQSVSREMVQKTSKIAIVAGNGFLPVQIIEKCIDLGKPYFLLVINDHGEEVLKKYNSDFVLHLNKIGKAIKYLKKNNIIEIIMIGAVNRPALKNMFPDLWTAKFLASISNKMLGDDKVLSNLAIALEKEGFKIIAPENILPNILSKKGVMGKISPQESHLRDIKIGFEIARNIGKYDIGQSLVIEDGLIIALEAVEGTTAMINRASKYKKSRSSAILIKVLKYNQEKRIDRPTIGVKTIKQIAKSGFAGIVAEANEVLIIDYEKTIETADKNNIFIQGV